MKIVKQIMEFIRQIAEYLEAYKKCMKICYLVPKIIKKFSNRL